MRDRRPTATSAFGVGRRESHDASGFYRRFHPPAVSDADDVLPPKPVAEPFVCGDARSMGDVADGSVALVVTSPPYFAGKQYEEELEREGVPGSYLEYLQLLTDVFTECVRTLEPGGRIAVNVANLGRKPYRSLSADVVRILQDELGLLLRGELVWQKGEGATGSCAWGSFRSASNPVLRDLTERVVVASKGRFDRARSVAQRRAEGLPHLNTLPTEDFLTLTLDLWSIPAESARRVGHPAPFPVELPEQLIRLYTYADDLVLDPFMGSGSTLVAAARLGRRYVGYDLDPAYVEIARRRVAEAESEAESHPPAESEPPAESHPPAEPLEAESRPPAESLEAESHPPAESSEAESEPPAASPVVGSTPVGERDGRADQLAAAALAAAGFTVTRRNARVPKAGLAVSFVATDAAGREWWFDVAGANTSHRGGLLRTDTVWKALGRASAARGRLDPDAPFVLLTTDLPDRRGAGDRALRAAGPRAVFDVVDVRSDQGRRRLAGYAADGPAGGPRVGFWTARDLGRGAGS